MENRFICLKSNNRHIRRTVIYRLAPFVKEVDLYPYEHEEIFNQYNHWAVIFDQQDQDVWEEPGIGINSHSYKKEYLIFRNKDRDEYYDIVIDQAMGKFNVVFKRSTEVCQKFCRDFLTGKAIIGLLGQQADVTRVYLDYLKRRNKESFHCTRFLSDNGIRYDFHYDMLSYKGQYILYKDGQWGKLKE